MTVSYTAQVATCKGFGCFLKLLWRWRGSIYKLVWLDLICFLLLYYTLNLTYRFALDPAQKETFEAVVKYCSVYSNLIPLSFVLGFYVSIVMTRWWNQYTSIPWPDPIAVFVSATIHGQDERGRVMRRTIMRYVCLCVTMVLGNISPRVKKRFPTLHHLVEAGLLIENERLIIEDLNVKFPRHSKHWLPIVWAASIVTRARKEGRIRDDFAVKTIIDELNKFRGQCGLLISYDTISIPLVYTQVVTLAVYSYFITSVIGQQWIDNKSVEGSTYTNKVDMYFPIFTTLQFFFYMGWLKVAEQLINPFGEDDDDFEVNWIVDRNLQVSYIIVDEMHHDHPELLKDQYWDEGLPTELPYTVASMSNNKREEPPEASTANIEVKQAGQEIMTSMPSGVKIDEMIDQDDNASGIHFSAGSRKRNASSSTTSMHSVTGAMTRVNTVTSLFKRFLSRDDGNRPPSSEGGNHRLGTSASSASITGKYPPHGSMKIADQVIEEVDEQMTITSMRGQEMKPTAQSVFAHHPPMSEPVDVPGRVPYFRTRSAMPETDNKDLFPPGGVDDLLSCSAPVTSHFQNLQQSTVQPNLATFNAKAFGSQETEKSLNIEELDSNIPADDFEKLKLARELERAERQKQKVARSISSQQGIVQQMELDAMEAHDILMENMSRATSPTSAPAADRRSGQELDSNL